MPSDALGDSGREGEREGGIDAGSVDQETLPTRLADKEWKIRREAYMQLQVGREGGREDGREVGRKGDFLNKARSSEPKKCL